MKRQINIWAVIEVGCYLLTGAGLFYLVFSKHYLDFVTPKMKGYLIFSGIVFVVWGIADIPGSRKVKYKRKMGHCVLLLLPMFLLTIGSRIGSFHEAVNGFHSADEAVEVFAGTSDVADQSLSGLDTVRQEIEVKDEEYLGWMASLLREGRQYEGYMISLKGMIYQENGMEKSHEFWLIRKVMSCCAADVMPVGIKCHWEGDLSLLKSEWVTVYAKVQIREDEECYLEVRSIMEEQKPKEEYLYGN